MNRKAVEQQVLSAVRKVYQAYPSCEWDDLVGQAWLIVTEEIGEYDPKRGASLKTYIHQTVHYKLQDYVRRVVLKELNMDGRRIHTDVYDSGVSDCTAQVEARDLMDQMLTKSSGVSRDILTLMFEEGLNQSEVAERLDISKQRVSQLVTKVKEGVEWNLSD